MNRLAEESSPYLQQHKDNPVEWYPWGKEAFRKAKQENKPVFLSIGYSTCHWCHVMAHESFEDEEIAGKMNDVFINIKVDREELPHVDSMYMTVCQMINGHGGWPLTIVMTPDKEPFFAATYIPKEARQNRIGMRQLIPGIKGMWKNEPERVRKAVEKIKEGFSRSQLFDPAEITDRSPITNAVQSLKNSYEPEYGGFGSSPKFPSPHNLMFLMREYLRDEDEELKEMIVHTLKCMRAGGLWDHVGFGFHRYSTDREWLLPHFEKMLYDQAMLMMAYTEAWQLFGEPAFRQTAEEIRTYINRDLRSDSGLYFAAEDADSEGEEGKFYVFTTDEMQDLLGKEQGKAFAEHYQFIQEGNFRDEATGERNGRNIPHLKQLADLSKDGEMEELRQKVFAYREKRVRPGLDNKILTDWNALMITALAKAGSAFSDEDMLTDAENAFAQLMKEHFDDREGLFHIRNSKTEIPAVADDYAFLIRAALQLYQSTAEPGYLRTAIELNERFTKHFFDSEEGGFYLSVNEEDQVLGLQKQIFDGAVPSSNSMAMLNLADLERLTGEPEYGEQLQECLKRFAVEMKRSGGSITLGMMALQKALDRQAEIVVTAHNKESAIAELRRSFIPDAVWHVITPETAEQISELNSYTGHYPVETELQTYVCRNFACEAPVTGIEALKEQIGTAFRLYD